MARRTILPADQEPAVPSSRVTFFLREAIRRMWVSKRTSIVAILMIAMSLFTLGAFLIVSENLGLALERWQGRANVNVYFEPSATPEQIRRVEAFLAGSPELAQKKFIGKEEALKRFKSYFSNLTDVVVRLDENPFPPSFEIEVTPQIIQSRAFDDRIRELRAMPGVDQVQFDWEWVDRLRRLIKVVTVAGFIAGGILGIAAAFTIANVIRLTMMLYREEIEIMRLVGATERIIRGPFIVEGLLQGTAGALLAVLFLFISFESVRRSMTPGSSLLWGFLFVTFLPWQKIAGLIVGGMIAGWLGSWMSVRSGEAG